MYWGDILFNHERLSDVITHHVANAKRMVDEVPEANFQASTDDQVVDHVAAQFRVHPIALYPERKTQERLEVDLNARDYDRFGHYEVMGATTLKGLLVKVTLPFEGDSHLFRCQPNTFTYSPPYGSVERLRDGTLAIVFGQRAPSNSSPEVFLRAVRELESGIVQYVEWIRRDLGSYQTRLEGEIRQSIATRRERLRHFESITTAINLPVTKSPSAPPLEPIAVRKVEIPPLAPASNAPRAYGIEEKVYECILDVFRHEGRSFERTPATYAKLDEEELRDVMLAHLNGHFRGAAGGETFRKKGKTDICIEFENRAAFVAECKNWGGKEVAQSALSQLLGYLTWRDCKTALVLLNFKVAGFADIQTKMPQILREHPQFERECPSQSSGEWRIVAMNPDDPQRKITVHVFLFNLYVKGRQ